MMVIILDVHTFYTAPVNKAKEKASQRGYHTVLHVPCSHSNTLNDDMTWTDSCEYQHTSTN